MTDTDDLSNKIFSLLKGNRLKIKIFDKSGAETTDPTAGKRFFVSKPNIMVTIDDDNNLIEFSKGKDVNDNSVSVLQKNIRRLGDNSVPPTNFKIKVFGKSIQPKDYSYQAKMNKGEKTMMEQAPINSHMIAAVLGELDYAAGMTAHAITDNIPHSDLNQVQRALNKLLQDGKVDIIDQKNGQNVYGKKMEEAITGDSTQPPAQPQRRHYDAPQQTRRRTDSLPGLRESFSKMFGSLRTSRQTLENVKILIKHKTPIDENVRGARSRQISAIFLECNGERFRLPHAYLPGARAMAQHVAHGGTLNDKIGSYISESTGNLLKLQSFNRYVTINKLINEDSSAIIDTVKENIETIRTELKKLTGAKTYETVKARIETFERESLVEDDISQLKDLFTIRRFDEKFEEVLPIVKQLVQEKDTFYKRIEEAASKSVVLRNQLINTTPMFEFASEHARLGFKINELALRIVENEELAGFINKIGTKLCKEGTVNDFERAVLSQVFENIKLEEKQPKQKTEIKESIGLEAYFDRFDYTFTSEKLNESKYDVTFHLKPNGSETMTGVEASSKDEAIRKAKISWRPSKGYTAKKITAKEIK
jgi:hypothetical protein